MALFWVAVGVCFVLAMIIVAGSRGPRPFFKIINSRRAKVVLDLDDVGELIAGNSLHATTHNGSIDVVLADGITPQDVIDEVNRIRVDQHVRRHVDRSDELGSAGEETRRLAAVKS